MSNEKISLTLEKRVQIGKGLNKIKNEGRIPAVINNHGADSIIVSGSFVELTKVYKQAGKHHPVNIKVDGTDYLTIIKDVDFDPKKHMLRHVVFNAIRQNEKVETEVPIILLGDIPAKKAGHMVLTQLDHVQVSALPNDLPDSVSVSAETLVEIGDRITVADLVIPKGVTILNDIDHPIATVEETAAEMSEEAAEETTETTEATAEAEQPSE